MRSARTIRRRRHFAWLARPPHMVAGSPRRYRAFASVLIFSLACSGLPWSSFWGNRLNTFANLSGVGYPAQGSWSLPSSSIVADRVAVIALVAEKLVGIDGEPLTFDVTGGEAHEKAVRR
jgi:uncharacterized iron-regulated membrane protein